MKRIHHDNRLSLFVSEFASFVPTCLLLTLREEANMEEGKGKVRWPKGNSAENGEVPRVSAAPKT